METPADINVLTAVPPPEYIVAVSDLHIGAKVSRFEKKKIQRVFDLAKSRAQHVVLNGDIFELLDEYHKGKKHVKLAIDHAIEKLIDWIEHAPANCRFHYVLGNHENVPGFRERLDMLQQQFPDQFEWHPEAIMVGDTLFTHGDLQGRGQTDKIRPKKPHGKDNFPGHTWIASAVEGTPRLMTYIKKKAAPEVTAHCVSDSLLDRADKGSRFEAGQYKKEDQLFHVLVDGAPQLLTNALFSRVKHVCFGHTHVKFSSHEINGVCYHNTGGVTKGFDNKRRELGFIAAEIDHAGQTHDLVPYHQYIVDPTRSWEAYARLLGRGGGYKQFRDEFAAVHKR